MNLFLIIQNRSHVCLYRSIMTPFSFEYINNYRRLSYYILDLFSTMLLNKFALDKKLLNFSQLTKFILLKRILYYSVTLITCLPKLSPVNKFLNACGAFSKPSSMVTCD